MVNMDTAEKLNQAVKFITRSREELQAGKVVVLEGFQEEVRKLCEDIAALSPQNMLEFAPQLQQLSDDLRIFEQELRSQQTLVQQDIFSLNRKQKALKTYQTVSHSHKENPENGNN